jgi:hypothetical protein
VTLIGSITDPVSFGLQVQRPWKLQTRTTGNVLASIRDGEWREPILDLRAMPPDSDQQREAKRELPFVTWSGVFSYKANDKLIQHSGQIGIDLDHLSAADCTRAMQDAVADPFCLAAFKSARGGGVRLLFRIPRCNAKSHDDAFEQVAEHVRNVYGHAPDPQTRDVSRASFVSFDEGLWCYPNAKALPVIIDLSHSDYSSVSRCVTPAVYSGHLAIAPWVWMGRYHVGNMVKPDGTVFTHAKLLNLGKAMALHAERIDHVLSHQDVYDAARAWFFEHERKGLRLRCGLDEYRAELHISVEGARSKQWFKASVEKWTRWTRHPDFPKHPVERLLFAIRKHCEDAATRDFFLGARDAGLVCGASYRTGARLLKRLVRIGKLKLLTMPDNRLPFHALDYRLIDD